MESFFSSLKIERVERKIYRFRNHAKAEVFEYGLAMPGNEALIPYAVRMLWAITDTRDGDGEKAKQYFQLANDFRNALSGGHCETRFLGVWDTVSSVGWIGSPVALPFSKRNPSVRTARHAVSIDEHRALFRTNLLSSPPGTDVRQVWSPGVHCDVGGGYRKRKAGCQRSRSSGWRRRRAKPA